MYRKVLPYLLGGGLGVLYVSNMLCCMVSYKAIVLTLNLFCITWLFSEGGRNHSNVSLCRIINPSFKMSSLNPQPRDQPELT